MKTILVTGGAGFIGSNLCKKLVELDKGKVISLDNYSTGTKTNHVDGVEYIKGETKDIFNIINFVPDLIFHLGEYSRVEQSFDDIETVWQSNSEGTFNVLMYAIQHNSKIIYAGSSTKFGDSGLGRDQSPYGWIKASNTDLVNNFIDWYGLRAAIVYFYNAFGDNEISDGKYATLIGIYKHAIINNQPLKIVRPGSQKRNFTHVDDIVDGLIKVAENGSGDGYGIGNDKAYTIDEVADMFGGEKVYLPERQGNRMSAEVITGKTKALGWKAKKELDEYIYKFLASINEK